MNLACTVTSLRHIWFIHGEIKWVALIYRKFAIVYQTRLTACRKAVWEVGRYGYCIGLKIRRSWFDTNTSHSSLGGFSESLYNSVTARLRKRGDPLKKLNGVGLRKSAHIVCDWSFGIVSSAVFYRQTIISGDEENIVIHAWFIFAKGDRYYTAPSYKGKYAALSRLKCKVQVLQESLWIIL